LKHVLSSDPKSPLQHARNAVKAANASTVSLPNPALEQSYFEEFRNKAEKVTLVPEIRQYMQDIVLFLRNHRLVDKGVSPKAGKDLEVLVRMLCVLHDYDFATPSLVAVAARKLFPFRVQVCEPIDEPSLKYGGDIKIVTQWMKKWDAELIVEDVINAVPPPL
jgi:MoxR-like ATPase